MQTVHVTDTLSAYIDGALRAGERAHVDRHLKTCEECRRHLEALRDLIALVQSAEPVVAPEGFRAEVRSRVGQMNSRQNAARRWPAIPIHWRVIAAAAAVAVIGIFAINVLRTEGPVATRDFSAGDSREALTGERLKSQPPSAAPSARDEAQRSVPRQSPPTQRLVIPTLLVLALGLLVWLAVRRRRE
jgi:predicted anti-sigma-YlaC factor YlaD